MDTMNHISSGFEPGPGLFQPAIPIAPDITEPSTTKTQALFPQTALEDIIRDFDDTQRQLNSLRDFLERAEFSAECRYRCDLVIRDLHLKANKVINNIECIKKNLNEKGFFRRSKYRLSLANKDLENVQREVWRINKSIAVTRQEIMLEIFINDRNESRRRDELIAGEVQKVNKKLIGTDAKQIRRIYSRVALDLMDPWNFMVVSPAPDSQVQHDLSGVTNALPTTMLPGTTDLTDILSDISKIFENPDFRQSTPLTPRMAELEA